MRILTATEYHAKTLLSQRLKALPVGSVLPSNSIQSWRRFFEAQLHIDTDETILSPLAEGLLWYEVVKAQSGRLHQECWAFAKMMQEAEHSRLLYGISIAELKIREDAQSAFFIRLLPFFEAALQTQEVNTFLRALSQYERHFEAVELYGFVDFPPLYQAVIKRCFSEVSIMGADQPLLEEGYALPVLEAISPQAEFVQAVQHIAAEASLNPQDSFALLVHPHYLNWTEIHLLLQSDLKETLAGLPYAVSMPPLLSDQPRFQFLEDYLAAVSSRNLGFLSRIWTSHFWEGSVSQRALWDQKLREKMPEEIDFANFLIEIVRISEGEIEADPLFQAWLVWQVESQKIQTLQAWLAQLKQHFQPAWPEWPHFLKKLAPFQRFSFFYSFQEFRQILQAVASQFYLHEPALSFPRLHIVGYLEAVHLSVDSVWLLGADETSLPLPAQRSTFIPEALLLAHHAPITPTLQRHYARALLGQVKGQGTLRASFVPEAEGFRIGLSSLLKEKALLLPLFAPENPAIEYEIQDDSVYLPLPEVQLQATRGGSRILEEQAACPFKAWAHFRLKAQALSPGEVFLSPLQKGRVLHRIFEWIWETLQTQQALLSIEEKALQALIQTSVQKALVEVTYSFEKEKKKIYQQLESRRLEKIVWGALGLEKERPSFRVLEREMPVVLNFAGLIFHLRIDRIDLLPSGRKVLIDYKTGGVSLPSLSKNRLEAPQLFLYALTIPECSAVSYMSLKSDKISFVGWAESEGLCFDQVQSLPDQDWPTQVLKWQEALSALALEFKAGCADVAPLPQACLYCDLKPLCRIQEEKER